MDRLILGGVVRGLFVSAVFFLGKPGEHLPDMHVSRRSQSHRGMENKQYMSEQL